MGSVGDVRVGWHQTTTSFSSTSSSSCYLLLCVGQEFSFKAAVKVLLLLGVQGWQHAEAKASHLPAIASLSTVPSLQGLQVLLAGALSVVRAAGRALTLHSCPGGGGVRMMMMGRVPGCGVWRASPCGGDGWENPTVTQ